MHTTSAAVGRRLLGEPRERGGVCDEGNRCFDLRREIASGPPVEPPRDGFEEFQPGPFTRLCSIVTFTLKHLCKGINGIMGPDQLVGAGFSVWPQAGM